MNLLSADCERVNDGWAYGHFLWSGPLTIAVALVLLLIEVNGAVGLAASVPLAFVCCCALVLFDVLVCGSVCCRARSIPGCILRSRFFSEKMLFRGLISGGRNSTNLLDLLVFYLSSLVSLMPFCILVIFSPSLGRMAGRCRCSRDATNSTASILPGEPDQQAAQRNRPQQRRAGETAERDAEWD